MDVSSSSSVIHKRKPAEAEDVQLLLIYIKRQKGIQSETSWKHVTPHRKCIQSVNTIITFIICQKKAEKR